MRDVLRRWWRRMRCDHDWLPVGFADWHCPKCGADSMWSRFGGTPRW